MTSPRAVIIGAGIGGLSTAIYLAKQGYRVTILEKNATPGGRCNHIIQDGYTFDTGPTFLIFPQIYRSLFTAMGEDIDEYLTLIRVDPAQKIWFADATYLEFFKDRAKLKAEMEKLEPGSSGVLQNFLLDVRANHRLVLERIIGQDNQRVFDFIKPVFWPLLFTSQAYTTHNRYMQRYFADPRLQNAFTFQDAYIGLNPYTTRALFSLFAYEELTNGVWLPQGGMYQVVQALMTIASKYEINVQVTSPVKQIIIKNKRAQGILYGKGQELKADLIVVNADLPYAYEKLLPPSRIEKGLKRKRSGCSTITFFWGLDRKFKQLTTHNIFLSDRCKQSYHQVIDEQRLPDKPHFYIHVGSRTDPTMAPPNCDAVSVIVPVGHITSPDQDWQTIQAKARAYVLTHLHKVGVKNIEQAIQSERVINPKDWQYRYNLTKGTTVGLHHNLRQMGPLRPQRQHPIYKNLYFVGSNTHPGCGVPTVLLSAKFTADHIVKTF